MSDALVKIPMQHAAKLLAEVCDEIDGADAIDARLRQEFEDASLNLGDGVDRRIAFDRWMKIQIEATAEGYRYYRDRKDFLETVHHRFKERTKKIIEDSEMPDAFRGKLGKISLCSSPAAVEYAFGSKEIDVDVAVMFGVPLESPFIKAKLTYTIDSAAVKAALLRGEELGWATLREGTHIRFPASKKKEIEG